MINPSKSMPLFRAGKGTTKRLGEASLNSATIRRLVKRRQADTGAGAAVAAQLSRVDDHRSLDASCAAGGCAMSGRACGAEDDGDLRPATEAGDAEWRRADFWLG
jgi:hypothetical protein